MLTFDELFKDCTKQATKIKKADYGETGKYPIIDQGQNNIAGFTDDKTGIFQDVPAIGFGDHTRIVKYIDEPCFLGADGIKLLKCKKNNANYKYLYYMIKNVKIPDTGYNRHFKWLKGEKFVYPNENEQKKTVNVLDRIQGMIQKRKAQLAELDKLAKSRFVELFGVSRTETNKWGLMKLSDCCEINPKKGEDHRLRSGLKVSFVAMSGISENGYIDSGEIKTYDEVKTGFTYFAENDVLFAKITPCMENGKGAVARGLCNGIGFGSTEFHVLRPIIQKTNPYWIYTLTSLEQFRKDAAVNMTGSAGQRRVPASYLASYMIPLPPLNLQNQFAAFVQRIDKSKAVIQKSLDETQLLFDSLMQKYFG